MEFCTLATGNEWNEPAPKAAFRQGLNPLILIELACCYVQQMLDSLIDLYIRLDKVLRNRPSLEGTTLNVLAMAPPTPMEISRTRSAHSEYEWRHKKELCFCVCVAI